MIQPFQQYPTGSAYIVGRAGAADVDRVLLFETRDEAAAFKTTKTLSPEGWEVCGNDYGMDEDTFFALRKGDDNLIVVWDYLLYVKWLAFTELAKAMGLTAKVDRIELSKAIVEDDAVAAQNIVRTANFHATAADITALYLG